MNKNEQPVTTTVEFERLVSVFSGVAMNAFNNGVFKRFFSMGDYISGPLKISVMGGKQIFIYLYDLPVIRISGLREEDRMFEGISEDVACKMLKELTVELKIKQKEKANEQF